MPTPDKKRPVAARQATFHAGISPVMPDPQPTGHQEAEWYLKLTADKYQVLFVYGDEMFKSLQMPKPLAERIVGLRSELATVTRERDEARGELQQVGWYGPYGIVPGGMDNAPHPNFRPIYLRKSDFATPPTPTEEQP